MRAILPPPQAGYALVGRSHGLETFEPLYQRSLVQRAERHERARGLRRSDGRRWHTAIEAVAYPSYLSA